MQEQWMYKTNRDYYGEEIQTILVKPLIAKQLELQLEELRNRSVAEKIEYVLKLEYGHLIPSVVNKKWFIKKVQAKDLEYSNTEHYLACQHDLETDLNYRRSVTELVYPRAIVVFNPNATCKVIDGYHRLVGTPTGEDSMVIYCLRE
jgi:hypothetical protein